jgi:hypothetical protein
VRRHQLFRGILGRHRLREQKALRDAADANYRRDERLQARIEETVPALAPYRAPRFAPRNVEPRGEIVDAVAVKSPAARSVNDPHPRLRLNAAHFYQPDHGIGSASKTTLHPTNLP